MRRLIAIQIGCAVVAVVTALPQLARVVREDGLPADQRLVPDATWSGVMFIGLAVSSIALPALLFTLGRAALAIRGKLFRIVYPTLAIVGQLGIVFAIFGVTFVLGDFLGPRLVGCSRSPTDRTACLYSGGMMCGYEVFVREPGDDVMTEARNISMKCDDQPPRALLVWSEGGAVLDLVDNRGRPMYRILPAQ
jgi:hypothetical protein